MNIPEQKPMWNAKHAAKSHDFMRGEHSLLAVRLAALLPANARILELGCGVGRDAEYFATQGYRVVATDFSEEVIEQNKALSGSNTISYSVLDMQEPLPYDSGAFDAVYAYLSLHYYTKEQTEAIIAEIHRVLKPSGILAFACKSYDSVRIDNASMVAPDVYVDKSGHALHVFTVDYTKQLTENLFSKNILEEKQETYMGRDSLVVTYLGTKK